MASISFTLAGYCAATLFCSARSLARLNNCGWGSLPISLPAWLRLGPLWAWITFQSSTISDRAVACSTMCGRPWLDLPSSAGSRLKLSGAASSGSLRPASAAKLASRSARLDAARPPHHEGHSRTAVVGAVFAAAQRAGRLVIAQLLDGLVAIAIVHHRAVVAGEDK